MGAIPWPDGVPYVPDLSSMSGLKRALDPIKTPFEGGNTRLRSRPGDNVGSFSQTVRMSNAELAVFAEWVKTTLANGTARFAMNVRLNGAFQMKTCQFSSVPSYQPIGAQNFDVQMQLTVYGL